MNYFLKVVLFYTTGNMQRTTVQFFNTHVVIYRAYTCICDQLKSYRVYWA